MKLEDIGFYTLSDHRALNSSDKSPLWRCELVLTDACNFKCTYCRGITNKAAKGTIELPEAKRVVSYWIKEGLKNVRFTGGEPTLYSGLAELLHMCRAGGVERIAISTNGSHSKRKYQELLNAGLNDISISLDACCATIGKTMSGGINKWERVIENIRWLSKRTYVTLGMVFTEENVKDCVKSVMFADSLGASDIRVIPSAQFNAALTKLNALPEYVLAKYPILKYRIKNHRHVRGLQSGDVRQCWLALDDMAVAQGKHFPCIIHLREGGEPIGKVNKNTRQDRMQWAMTHDSWTDSICKTNCLDVCVAFNNKAAIGRNIKAPIYVRKHS